MSRSWSRPRALRVLARIPRAQRGVCDMHFTHWVQQHPGRPTSRQWHDSRQPPIRTRAWACGWSNTNTFLDGPNSRHNRRVAQLSGDGAA
jgi:hypothetical protein